MSTPPPPWPVNVACAATAPRWSWPRPSAWGGHATHDEREARETFAAELFEHWGRRDPLGLFESYLLEESVPDAKLAELEAHATEAVELAAQEALASRDHLPTPEHALYQGISEGGVLHGLDARLSAHG